LDIRSRQVAGFSNRVNADWSLDSAGELCQGVAVVRNTVRQTVHAVAAAMPGVMRAAFLFGMAYAAILAPQAARASANAIIAPGQESLLAEMLGRGETLPGPCIFANGQVESALARCTYRCPAGALVLELRHSSQAAGAAATTDRFAIAIASGAPPAGFMDALVSRIRAREASFVWTSPGAVAGEPSTPEQTIIELDTRLLQVAWVILILASPILCWRGGHVLGVGGKQIVAVAAACVVLALAATWHRADEPLHANGHAWREAREVLVPAGARSTGATPFMHGQGGIALQWLLAAVEQRLTGVSNPLHISRWAGAGAAGATAFLTAVLARSPWAGLAAGCVLALAPLSRMLAVSGSALAIPEWILPWSLGLLIAAGLSGDRFLLVGAVLAAALGTLSHTAMLAWPPALIMVWLLVARRRTSLAAMSALCLLALAWIVQFTTVSSMLAARNQGSGGGLLGEAWRGVMYRNLILDPHWTSPLLLPMVLLWLVGGLRRERIATMLASVSAFAVLAPPFFAVTQCSSDAVRYQGALLGLVTSLAVAGLWSLPLVARLGAVATNTLRAALLAALVLLPLPSRRPPPDPVAVEHGLVVEAVDRMEPGTLVILPKGRFDQGRIIPDFPDFLLPEKSHMMFEDDPRIATHTGPRFVYLGLACISWNEDDGSPSSDVRPECRALREHAQPWMVRTLRSEDLPRSPEGAIWTFHRLSTGVPFGFFVPESR
jgi:hypothetical protein